MKHDNIRTMDPEDVAKAIGVTLEEWPGRCAEIAHKINHAALLPCMCFERYGHYMGPVAIGSLFYKRPLIQHGWLELEDGSVFDPLRWEFEQAFPYFWVSRNEDECAEYDVGGNTFRQICLGPCPAVDKERAEYPLPKGKAMWFVLAQIPNGEDLADCCKIDGPTLGWFANLSPEFLGEYAADVYRWVIEDCDRRALIPIDNRRLVLGDA